MEYLPDISRYASHFGYLGIFLFFISVDQLTPLPEEITLITMGYLTANHLFNPFIAGISAIAAFITVDTVYFFLARSGNTFLEKKVKRKKHFILNKYKKRLKEHFGISLLILCFIPRVRILVPVFAAITHLPYIKFLFFDVLGLIAFTTFYISLGIIFHSGLHSQIANLENIQHIIFTIAMLFLSILIIFFIRKTQQ